MKDIIFRGKCKDGRGWVEGGFHKHTKAIHCPLGAPDPAESDTVYLIIRDGMADWELPVPIEGIEVLPETVSQFTGLKDRNGKKIFEGDIVRINNSAEFSYVTMEEFQWLCKMPALQNWRHRLENNPCKYEVVGNLTDNPNMMEAANGSQG